MNPTPSFALSEKSKNNGIDVEEIVGDRAYVSSGNLDYCDEMGISLIALTNPAVAATAEPKDDGFPYVHGGGRGPLAAVAATRR